MAMIDMMSISGIRSYPPSEAKEKKAVIQFQTPLTLIVGHNGTGKTTIIECLNYVVANNLPPGAKNSAFVHDPKVFGEKEVKGQVKLKFKDVTGNTIVGTRSMTSTQKHTKIETKQLDGVIRKSSADGKGVQSISSRCTDFTKEMISRLGVSKAVIENVIFCHQEDSNWPLSEGKVLKQKFDAIFAATRYIKALESIRTLRKDQSNDIKIYNTELAYLANTKAKSHEITSELKKAEMQVLASNEHIKKIAENIEPIQLQLKDLDSVVEEVSRLVNDTEKLKTTRDEKLKIASSLEEKIETPFQGSKEELIKLARNSEEALQLKQMDLKHLDEIINRLAMEVKGFNEKKTELDKQYGKLQLEAENHVQQKEKRDLLIKQLTGHYNVEGFDKETFSVEEAKEFVLAIKEIYNKTVSVGKEKREQLSKEILHAENKIKELEKSLHSSNGVIEHKEKLVLENEATLDQIRAQLSHLVASESRLKSLESNVRRAEMKLNDFKRELNPAQAEDEITKLTEEKRDEETKLKQLREEERKMLQQSEILTRLEMLQKQKAEKEENVQYLMRRHQDSLDKIFIIQPEREALKSKLSDFIRKKEIDLRKITHESQIAKQDLAGKEEKKKLYVDEQRKTEREVSLNQQRIHEVCGDNDYNTLREQMQETLEKCQGNLVELDAFEKIYQRFISDLNSKKVDESGCPLCHKRFNAPREIRNLVDELKDKLKHFPERREKYCEEIQQDKEMNEKLMELAPIKARFDSLSAEVPNISEKIKDLTRQIEEQKTSLEKLEYSKSIIEKDEKRGRSLESDISKVDDCIFDLKELDRQLVAMESNKIQNLSSNHTMQSLRDEVDERQNKLDNLIHRIDQRRDQLMEFQKQQSFKEREVNELKSQKVKLEAELQERLQLQNRQVELTSTNQALSRDIHDKKDQLKPIHVKLHDAEETKADMQRSKDANEEQTRNKLEKIKSNGNKVLEINNAIEFYINEGRETALQENKNLLRECEKRIQLKEDEREKKKKDRNQITEEVSRQELRKRELDDNLDLINYREEIRNIDSQIGKFKSDLSKFGDYKELLSQRGSLQDRLDKYHKDRAGIAGRLSGFEDDVKRCKRELASSMYSNAETKHCDKMIDLRTTELAISDLDKYYKALDRAIMKYHGLKLQEINKIIKEYWIKTYKGNDIDTIEIVAEGDDDGASKARRAYNYRVCMIKGGTSLDMRGRCSAGQKVLASIIIRLALAETFCLNCGILALDEPTTNLDEANVRSLALALRDIIEIRMQQKNFQLIVITHDEEFLNDLGQGDYVDYYFRIYKDEKLFFHQIILRTYFNFSKTGLRFCYFSQSEHTLKTMRRWQQPEGSNELKLYNSLTREKNEFVPKSGKQVFWYSCGPTVYDASHMGHARSYITFDILRRVLSDYFNYDIFYVMNITDVDDKIINRARRNHLLREYENANQDTSKILSDLNEALPIFKAKMEKTTDPDKKKMLTKIYEGVIASETKIKERIKNIPAEELQVLKQDLLVKANDPLADWLDKQFGAGITDQKIFSLLTQHWEKEYHEDMEALNILPADVLTRVSQYVPENVAFIQKIVDNGFAYESNGSVYFDTIKFASSDKHQYAKLVPEAVGDLDALAEGEGDLSQTGSGEKHSDRDFVLWKASKPGEPFWDSPWGKGRPGWHIECSVMASDVLGSKIDIHTGGVDLKFPHHDNELAQSEDALKKNSCRQIRFAFLLHAWNSTLDYSANVVKEAEQSEKLFADFFLNVKDILRKPENVALDAHNYKELEKDLQTKFLEKKRQIHTALCDSIDTATTMQLMHSLIKLANVYIGQARQNEQIPNHSVLKGIAKYLTKMLKTFGANSGEQEVGFPSAGGVEGANREDLVMPYVEMIAEFREDVRKIAREEKVTKILKLCDDVRDTRLMDLGVKLEDQEGGLAPVVKLVDKETLLKEKEQKSAEIEKKKKEKEEAKQKQLLEKAAKEAKAMISPSELFKTETDKYSQFDESGLPTHDASGEKLSASQIKKLRKVQAQQEKIHQKYLAELKNE